LAPHKSERFSRPLKKKKKKKRQKPKNKIKKKKKKRVQLILKFYSREYRTNLKNAIPIFFLFQMEEKLRKAVSDFQVKQQTWLSYLPA
jgi:hypothetical protein